MKTKNIFKTLALAMLMPTMLLTTACSSEDDVVNSNLANIETVANKGYALPVTVNVTREGDKGSNRAAYNESTGKLAFTAGDKLFVEGWKSGPGQFAGTLTWVSGTTFTGTITTGNEYTGTADELFSGASPVSATLLPADYGTYSYLSIWGTYEHSKTIQINKNKPFATLKATAVEQFSKEQATSYSSGFALSPQNAILNFTIIGLTTSTDVDVALTGPSSLNITGSVTTDVSGNATFAVGVEGGTDLNDLSLTVAGNPITLVSSSKTLAAGKIYNITRSTGATVDLSTINANYTASNGKTLTGTLANNVKISIADGATVILNGVSINATSEWTSGNYAGITCEGNATIILSGTNTVKGFYEDYPGIYVPVGKTVTIQGSGSLTASSNGWAAGIGGGNTGNCGNITITGGNITATGGSGRAGIGGGSGACGNITITGGTITATGGNNAAGIGGGTDGTCGNITITSGVTRVTATKGNYAPNSIGAGGDGTCGTVTFGTQQMYNGTAWSPSPMVAGSYGGLNLAITTTTNTDDTWTLTPVTP